MSGEQLKVVRVQILPAELHELLKHYNDKNLETQLIASPLIGGAVKLDIWVGGVETVHSVILMADGTWQASSWVQA